MKGAWWHNGIQFRLWHRSQLLCSWRQQWRQLQRFVSFSVVAVKHAVAVANVANIAGVAKSMPTALTLYIKRILHNTVKCWLLANVVVAVVVVADYIVANVVAIVTIVISIVIPIAPIIPAIIFATIIVIKHIRWQL